MARNIDELLQRLDKTKSPEQQFQEKIAESILTTGVATEAPVVIEKTAEEKLAEYREIGKVIAGSIWEELAKMAEAVAAEEDTTVIEPVEETKVAEETKIEEVAPVIEETKVAEEVKVAEETKVTETPEIVTEKTAEQIQSEVLLTLYQIYK